MDVLIKLITITIRCTRHWRH